MQRLGSDLGNCIKALEALNGSLVQHSQASGTALWRFKHPTIGDAYASTLVESPELLGVYIQGSAPEKLVEQVTCGDVGIERAVIVPNALFHWCWRGCGNSRRVRPTSYDHLPPGAVSGRSTGF
ncbi:MAG TPA: hypothetical protein VNJ04_10915 [Gemmatimonadaceae bacterium]|nr:hypothetical protein [Gemmatimonadaceae bacterium]